MKRPASRRFRDIAIDKFGKEHGDPMRIRRMMGSVIVAQMLPGGTIKGGSAMKFRFGDEATRFTRDLDAARNCDTEAYAEQLAENLHRGWNGFVGELVRREPPAPEGIPGSYIMLPFEVKLSYNGKPWMTVPFELGANEVGDSDESEMGLSPDVAKVFVELGFPEPQPVPLMPIWHQIAQKLHAMSEAGSDRARDLVDLQIIASRCNPDLHRTRETCERLFASRHSQSWPPTIVVGNEWDRLYQFAREKLPVLSTAKEAAVWANELIAKIDAASDKF